MANAKSITVKTGASHPIFEANPGMWEAVHNRMHEKLFHRDDRVITHGDNAANLWLVYKGWVKLTRQTPDGKETIIGLCTEGDVFGKAAIFVGASYPYTAEIIGDEAQLASIPAALIQSVAAKDAAASSRLLTLFNERMSQAQLMLEHMSTMTAAQRLGCFLLRICHKQADGEKTLHIPIEKNILATHLGMKPETLSRSQQQLKPLGIHVAGPEIRIDNIAKLREFVCGSCSESGHCVIDEDNELHGNV